MTQADIQRVMASLKVSEAEAVEILKADEAIDDGEKLFEQTAEQKKASKAMTAAGGGKHKEKAKRERLKNYQNVTDTEFSFEFNGNQYSVRLIKHRPAK